jgi:hypothetical protein
MVASRRQTSILTWAGRRRLESGVGIPEMNQKDELRARVLVASTDDQKIFKYVRVHIEGTRHPPICLFDILFFVSVSL